MAVREYIGARYVPIFADPIQWDPTTVYEPLTVVTDQGASYVSRQSVPTGIQLNNTDYWILWADYNAQLQHYIDEVNTFDGRIDDLEDAMPIADFSSASTVKDSIDVVKDVLPFADFSSASTVKDSIDAVKDVLPFADFDSVNTVKKRIDDLSTAVLKTKVAVIGDSFSTNAGSDTPWTTILDLQLQGKTIVNMANNGAGFTVPDNTFIGQLQTLKANYTISEFSHIILYGGINDYHRWMHETTTIADIKSAFDAFRAEYNSIAEANRPKLIFAFGNVGRANRVADSISYNRFIRFYTELFPYLQNIDMPGLVGSVQYWHFEHAYLNFVSDNLHPNDRGHRVIASYMMQLMNGTYNGVHFERIYMPDDILDSSLSSDSVTDDCYINVSFDDGIISVNALLPKVKPSSNNSWVRLVNKEDTCFAFGQANANDRAVALVRHFQQNYIDSNGNALNYIVAFNTTQADNFYIRTEGNATTFSARAAESTFSTSFSFKGN